MAEVKNSRPFQERFLNGYNRSQLSQEVLKVRPKRLKGLKNKYVTCVLGTSLALGLGVPLKVIGQAQNAISHVASDGRQAGGEPTSTAGVAADISGDLQAAQRIARQVAGGVAAATQAPLSVVVEAPRKLTAITEAVKEQFFAKNVPFGSIIYHEARKNALPPELVAAVVQQESKFQPTARSGAGAVGLMQLVPKTGRWLGARDLTNPAQNIRAGVKYLRYLHDRFGGDEQKAIAAYNAGEGNVRRFNGVPPFRETRNYVERVKSFQQGYADRLDSHTAELSAAAGATLLP